jgi:hypothetical protein
MTTEPNELTASINHERMPVLMPGPADFETWLSGSVGDAPKLARSYAAERMRIVQSARTGRIKGGLGYARGRDDQTARDALDADRRGSALARRRSLEVGLAHCELALLEILDGRARPMPVRDVVPACLTRG